MVALARVEGNTVHTLAHLNEDFALLLTVLCPSLALTLSLPLSGLSCDYQQTIKHLIFLSQQNSIYLLKCQRVMECFWKCQQGRGQREGLFTTQN